MMILFYLIPILFIYNELYHIYNKQRFDNKLFRKIDIFYYILKLFFFIWIIIGFWANSYLLFIILASFYLFEFPLYYINKKLYIIWKNILPIISIIFIIIIMIRFFIFNI